MPQDSRTAPGTVIPLKPTLATHIGAVLGLLLLIIGTIAVVANVTVFLVATSRPSSRVTGLDSRLTGLEAASAEHLRSLEMVGAGGAAVSYLVLLVLPGWYLRRRAREHIREYERYTESVSAPTITQKPKSFSGKLIIRVVALAIILGVFLIWTMR